MPKQRTTISPETMPAEDNNKIANHKMIEAITVK